MKNMSQIDTNNNLYMSESKTQTVKLRDKIVDLKETTDLYGRMMSARSGHDIDLML